jgi:hypothetical protein
MRDDASELGVMELVDDEGRPVTIGSAWADQPALLVFVRHYG